MERSARLGKLSSRLRAEEERVASLASCGHLWGSAGQMRAKLGADASTEIPQLGWGRHPAS